MLIFRWQATTPPNQDQIKSILRAEGLEPIEEVFLRDHKHPEKRHPFGEIRIVAKGELVLNVAGTQLLLRAGTASIFLQIHGILIRLKMIQ